MKLHPYWCNCPNPLGRNIPNRTFANEHAGHPPALEDTGVDFETG
jgi:hypothetical protein